MSNSCFRSKFRRLITGLLSLFIGVCGLQFANCHSAWSTSIEVLSDPVESSVSAKNPPLYNGPSNDSDVLAKLMRDLPVTVIGYSNDGWLEVLVDVDGDGAITDGFTLAAYVHVPVISLTLNAPSAGVEVGSSIAADYEIYPPIATNLSVQWLSSDTDVLTVSSDGILNAIGVGSSTLTVSAADGVVTTSAEYMVYPAAIDSVNFLSPQVTSTVTASLVGLMSAPSERGVLLSELSLGTTVVVSGYTDDGWLLVDYETADENWIEGYIASNDVNVPVTSLSMTEPSSTLVVGETVQPAYSIYPVVASNQLVTWASNNDAVITVDQLGNASAVSPGSATVTVSTNDGLFVSISLFTVVSRSLDGHLVLPQSVDGTVAALKAWVMDTPSEDGSMELRLSRGEPILVTGYTDDDWLAVEGETEDYGAYSGYLTVEQVNLTGMQVTVSASSSTLQIGGTASVGYSVYPPIGADFQFSLESDNEYVASIVGDTGLYASGIGMTNVTVSVETDYGTLSASTSLTVWTPNPIPMTGIQLDQESKILAIGDRESLEATVLPSDASDRRIVWTSSNPSAVGVDSYGNVHAVGIGSATVTATTSDGVFTDSCLYTVKTPEPVTGVELKDCSAYVGNDSWSTLTANVYPSTATDRQLTWSSDNPDVVDVDDLGNVFAWGQTGVATVTVSAANGTYSDSCLIHVDPIPPVGGPPAGSLVLTPAFPAVMTGKTLQLSANKPVTWASAATSKATVNSSTGLLTGKIKGLKKSGVVDITATAKTGSASARTSVMIRTVEDVQNRLNQLFCLDGNNQQLKVDGVWGGKSSIAFNTWQRANHRSTSSYPGSAALGALFASGSKTCSVIDNGSKVVINTQSLGKEFAAHVAALGLDNQKNHKAACGVGASSCFTIEQNGCVAFSAWVIMNKTNLKFPKTSGNGGDFTGNVKTANGMASSSAPRVGALFSAKATGFGAVKICGGDFCGHTGLITAVSTLKGSGANVYYLVTVRETSSKSPWSKINTSVYRYYPKNTNTKAKSEISNPHNTVFLYLGGHFK